MTAITVRCDVAETRFLHASQTRQKKLIRADPRKSVAAFFSHTTKIPPLSTLA